MARLRPPVPPFTERTFRSPLRGPWLTSVFGSLLLVGLPIVIITGLLSYAAYSPQFGQGMPAEVGYLRLPSFAWPTGPSWLYRLTQGLHVGLGVVLIPVVLAKLWSVVPKLFAWPPARSTAALLERVSLVALVGGILFELVTGTLNIQYDYIFGFSFYTGHYWGAWVFIAGFAAHVAIKLPTVLRSLRRGAVGDWLHDTVADTEPEPPDEHGLVAEHPREATLSRRGLLGMVAAGSVLVAAVSVGKTAGDSVRATALLDPRGRTGGDGPSGFPVNRTAATAGIPGNVGDGWRLALTGADGTLTLTRDQLLALPLDTAELPIACVEGWSSTQSWTGTRLQDLAALAGHPNPASAVVRSVERAGAFNQATLQRNQVLDPDAMLALKVNNTDLTLDHGYPARVIVPALPGVHNTKWVSSITFRDT